jgi:hypothetical protein
MLISKAFNLETVAQGQAVGRLNALALIFLPLSYVAVSASKSVVNHPALNSNTVYIRHHDIRRPFKMVPRCRSSSSTHHNPSSLRIT